MKRMYAILLGLVVLVSLIQPVFAQSVNVPITTPVHGMLIFPGNLPGTIIGPGDNQLLLVDTYNGQIDILTQNDLGVLSPVWSPEGNRLAFSNFFSGPAISVYDLSTRTFTDIVNTPGYISYPQSWAPDGSQFLSKSFESTSTGSQYQLQLVTPSDGTVTPLFTFVSDVPVDDVPLPVGTVEFNVTDVKQVVWNPVYADWVLIQLEVVHPR